MDPNPNLVKLTPPLLSLIEFEGLDNEETFGNFLIYSLKSNDKLDQLDQLLQNNTPPI